MTWGWGKGGGIPGEGVRCEVTDHLDTATPISKTLPVASEGYHNEAARYFIGLLQSNRQISITPCGTSEPAEMFNCHPHQCML